MKKIQAKRSFILKKINEKITGQGESIHITLPLPIECAKKAEINHFHPHTPEKNVFNMMIIVVISVE